jgi:diadenosine tetraphosphatase ApaH/serine/threonine PP2A family protein phosphatase
MFHATPRMNTLYWREDCPESFFLEMAGQSPADLYLFGHTHLPFSKRLDGKTFVNCGSVGLPKDGDPRACLAVVDISGEDVRSSVMRIEYDIDRTVHAILDEGLPDAFAERIRRGH